MSRASSLLALLLLASTACRRPRVGAPDAAPVATDRGAPAPVDAAREAPAPATAWCFEAMPRADVRAVDDEGHLWRITGGAIARDDEPLTPLADEIPCPMPGAYALEFVEGGAAFALVDGRFYVRPTRRAPFVVTPVCTDIGGAPWSRLAPSGWSVIADAHHAAGPGLLLTRAADAHLGWVAMMALDRSLRAGVLDEQRSMLSLVNDGHLVLVDQRQTAAGELLAAQGERFTTLSRAPAGVVAAHDEPGGRRVLVMARSLAETFARVESTRDNRADTRAVMALDLARVVAVTDHEVELSVDGGRSFRTVLRVPGDDGGEGALARPHVGRLRDGRLAVATRGGVAADRCR